MKALTTEETKTIFLEENWEGGMVVREFYMSDPGLDETIFKDQAEIIRVKELDPSTLGLFAEIDNPVQTSVYPAHLTAGFDLQWKELDIRTKAEHKFFQGKPYQRISYDLKTRTYGRPQFRLCNGIIRIDGVSGPDCMTDFTVAYVPAHMRHLIANSAVLNSSKDWTHDCWCSYCEERGEVTEHDCPEFEDCTTCDEHWEKEEKIIEQALTTVSRSPNTFFEKRLWSRCCPADTE
jgi:hypothetical protein